MSPSEFETELADVAAGSDHDLAEQDGPRVDLSQLNEPQTTLKPAGFRAGFVALVGQPNAGKSTLLNAILDDKVSIVTDKPQTTRKRVVGILNLPQAQVVFVDAPGVLKSKTGINGFLQTEADDVVKKADVICAVLSSEDSEARVIELVEKIRANSKKANVPWFAVITKADLLGGTRTPRYFGYLISEQIPFVSITATERRDEAVEEILKRVLPNLPLSPSPLFDEEIYTTQTVRQMTAEYVREAAFKNLREEIPYGLAVRILTFDESGPVVKISCEIVVDKASHKGIVIGAGGLMLKKIGTAARLEMERVLGQKVFLQLHVHVTENWTANPRVMKELGYVVPKE